MKNITVRWENNVLKNDEKMHRQARGYLKTVASLVGRDTREVIPFDSHTCKDYNDSPTIKEAISKMAAVAGNYLFQLWQSQKDSQGRLVINNLSTVADHLGIKPQRLKLYLVCLGGYEYPVIKFVRLANNKNRLTISHEKLCYIELNFNLKDDEIEAVDDLKIGTRYLYFIKYLRVSTVMFKPTDSTLKQLERKRLGNNVLVSDSFVAFCLELSDIAYKLLCYTGSNRPMGNKISFSKLVREIHLNLERQLKQQGKPRVLESIKKGFEELSKKGHIKHWNYDDRKDEFTWEYTNQVFKHSDFTK